MIFKLSAYWKSISLLLLEIEVKVNKRRLDDYLRLAHACLGSKLACEADIFMGLVNCLAKHALQYTGLPGVGLNGTVATWLHVVHFTS
jgi:hypothetical protein